MPAPFGAGISVCQRTCTVAHIGGRRAGPMCPAAQGIRIPLASLCEGGGSAKRWRREFVGADDSVRPNSAKRCHSEPVRTLARESVSPCLSLRGRWQREALAEGEIPHGFLSPSRLRRQPPPRGGCRRGTAALTGRRTPRAFVSLRSTAGHRPLRPMCGCTRLSFRRGRCPHRPAVGNRIPAAGPMCPALQGACVRADRVDEPTRSQISEGGLV